MNTKYEDLEKLAKLKAEWVLSEDEYLKEKNNILHWKDTVAPYSPKSVIWLSFILWPVMGLTITYHNYKTLWRKDFFIKTRWIFIFILLWSIELIFSDYQYPTAINIIYGILLWLISVGIFTNLQIDEINKWKQNNPERQYKHFINALWLGVLSLLIWFIFLMVLFALFNFIYPELWLLE